MKEAAASLKTSATSAAAAARMNNSHNQNKFMRNWNPAVHPQPPHSTMNAAATRNNRAWRLQTPQDDNDMDKSSSSGNNNNALVHALSRRLEEILIMELHRDGSREFLHFTVRDLYKHVMNAITTTARPPMMIPSHVQHLRQSQLQKQRPSSSSSLSMSLHRWPSVSSSGGILPTDESNKDNDNDNNDEATPQPELTTTPYVNVDTGGRTVTFHDPVHSTVSEPLLSASTGTAGSWNENNQRSSRRMSYPHSPPLHATSLPLPPPPPRCPGHHRHSLYRPHPHPPHHHEGGGDFNNITYRERMGGYLHPRDMRRLVTPFSASNEPALMVRRHAILMNFDPLRAVVLRDRLLVLVPHGADSLLSKLERRVRGLYLYNNNHNTIHNNNGDHNHGHHNNNGEKGHSHIENFVLGAAAAANTTSSTPFLDEQDDNNNVIVMGVQVALDDSAPWSPSKKRHMENLLHGTKLLHPPTSVHDHNNNSSSSSSRERSGDESSNSNQGGGSLSTAGESHNNESNNNSDDDNNNDDDDNGDGSDSNDDNESYNSEWAEMNTKEWIDLPFELQCSDAVLNVVCSILTEDAYELQESALDYLDNCVMGKLRIGDDPLTGLRHTKDAIREMTSRIKGFVKSMNRILDEDEDMALMNLSRLLTHPERYIKPVDQLVLEEESDEPELILESHLQVGLSIMNAMELLQGQVDSASELVDQKLDTVRNRILFANMIISIFALAATTAAIVGSFFGMNVKVPYEQDDGLQPFFIIVFATIGGAFLCTVLVLAFLIYIHAIPLPGASPL